MEILVPIVLFSMMIAITITAVIMKRKSNKIMEASIKASFVKEVVYERPKFEPNTVYYIDLVFNHSTHQGAQLRTVFKVIELDRTDAGTSLVKPISLVWSNQPIDKEDLFVDDKFFISTASLVKSSSQNITKSERNNFNIVSTKKEKRKQKELIINEEAYNKVLDKIGKKGIKSLTKREQRILDEYANKKSKQ